MKKVRPLNGPHGDMVPVRSKNQMLEGAEAVAQIVVMRICLNRGEWWEDEALGFRVPDFLEETARQSDLDMLSKYIATYISSSYGVAGVTNVSAEYDDHILYFRCTVYAMDGKSAKVEVNLSELLR